MYARWLSPEYLCGLENEYYTGAASALLQHRHQLRTNCFDGRVWVTVQLKRHLIQAHGLIALQCCEVPVDGCRPACHRQVIDQLIDDTIRHAFDDVRPCL